MTAADTARIQTTQVIMWAIIPSTGIYSMSTSENNLSRTAWANAAEICPLMALQCVHMLQLLRTPVRLLAAVERLVQTPVVTTQEGVRAKTKEQTREIRNRDLGSLNGSSQDDGRMLAEVHGKISSYCRNWVKKKTYFDEAFMDS